MDLTNYAVQTRYPGQYTEITKIDLCYENIANLPT